MMADKATDGHWAPGLIGEIADWIDSCAVHRARVLSVAAAVSVVCTLAGRRYALPGGARAILHSVGVARTGVGKEIGRQCAIGLLTAAGHDKRIGADDVTSAAALVTLLRDCPTKLLLLDELGRLLEAYGSGNAASHERGIVTSLIRLWSSGPGKFLGRAYAERPPQSVMQPHAVMYATTTPESLIRSLKGSDVVDGVLSRLLLWRVPHGQLAPARPTGKPLEPPAQLVAMCKGLARGPEGGNLSGLESADLACDPVVVPLSDAAEEAAGRIGDRVRERLEGDAADLWVRAREQSLRLALAAAVSCGSLRVEVEHLKWAWQIVRWSTQGSAELVAHNVAETEEGRAVLAVLALLERRGGHATRSEITRALHRIDRRVRESALASGLDSGRIVRETVVVRGKTADAYRLASSDELEATTIESANDYALLQGSA
jgi:hypothetical protein